MRKVILNLGAALTAFVVGTTAVRFAPHRQIRHAAETVATGHADVNPVAKAVFPLRWREIRAGRVSFKIPAQLRTTGSPGGVGVVEAFRGDVNGLGLYVCYEYGRLVSADVNPPVGPSRGVVINGKRGILSVREYDPWHSLNRARLETSVITLYLPDLGEGGDKFELYVASLDLSAARQVIDTVEIR